MEVLKMNKSKKLLAAFIAIALLASIPLAIAAPVGTSESATVKAAQGWIGVKDVAGGNSRSGIDCSHMVYQVYKSVGAKGYSFMKVPAMKNNRYFVTTSSPRPGDVIFWKKDVKTSKRTYWLAAHVGIYIGGGKFIHTSWDTKKVSVDSVQGVYKTGQPYYAKWSKK